MHFLDPKRSSNRVNLNFTSSVEIEFVCSLQLIHLTLYPRVRICVEFRSATQIKLRNLHRRPSDDGKFKFVFNPVELQRDTIGRALCETEFFHSESDHSSESCSWIEQSQFYGRNHGWINAIGSARKHRDIFLWVLSEDKKHVNKTANAVGKQMFVILRRQI